MSLLKGQPTGSLAMGPSSRARDLANPPAAMAWHAEWDLDLGAGGSELISFPGATSPGVRYEPPLPGTSMLSGSTAAKGPTLNCSGSPTINPHYTGVTDGSVATPILGSQSPLSNPNSLIIPMWAETFGGNDYIGCDGILPSVGFYGNPAPGYPGWDTPAGIATFNLDLTQWYQQPDHSMSIPIESTLTPLAGGWDSGTGTVVTGVITITSKTVPPAGPSPSNRTPKR